MSNLLYYFRLRLRPIACLIAQSLDSLPDIIAGQNTVDAVCYTQIGVHEVLAHCLEISHVLGLFYGIDGVSVPESMS